MFWFGMLYPTDQTDACGLSGVSSQRLCPRCDLRVGLQCTSSVSSSSFGHIYVACKVHVASGGHDFNVNIF